MSTVSKSIEEKQLPAHSIAYRSKFTMISHSFPATARLSWLKG